MYLTIPYILPRSRLCPELTAVPRVCVPCPQSSIQLVFFSRALSRFAQTTRAACSGEIYFGVVLRVKELVGGAGVEPATSPLYCFGALSRAELSASCLLHCKCWPRLQDLATRGYLPVGQVFSPIEPAIFLSRLWGWLVRTGPSGLIFQAAGARQQQLLSLLSQGPSEQ